MMRCHAFGVLFLFVATAVHSQVFTEQIQLDWEAAPRSLQLDDTRTLYYPHFKGASYDEANPQQPLWVKRFPLNEYSRLTVELLQPQYAPVPSSVQFQTTATIGENLVFEAPTLLNRRQPVGLVRFCPIRRNPITQQYEQLVSGQLRITATPAPPPFIPNGVRNTTTSILSDGEVYKIAATASGIYKINYTMLRDMGVDVNNLDPRTLQLYGNTGKPVPEMIDDSRVDDLRENAIWVQGEADGRFDENDYILFYVLGTRFWQYNTSKGQAYESANPYTDTCYYFLKIGNAAGKRIQSRSSVTLTAYTTDAYDALQQIEPDQNNLLEDYFALPASGRRWFGDRFQMTRSRTYNFSFSNIISTEPVKIRTLMTARVMSSGGSFAFSANGTNIYNEIVPTVTGGIYDPYAKEIVSDKTFMTNSNSISIGINFSHPSTGAEAWLDYIAMQARCRLSFTGKQMPFRDFLAQGKGTATYQFSNNGGGATIWDVTEPMDPVRQETTTSGGNLSFGVNVVTNQEFIAFDDASFLDPIAEGRMENQNLHGIITPPNVLIVYHRDFEQAAQLLAEHRQRHSNLTTLAVEIHDIYNEFSSGNPDVTALRDFVKMLYDRETPTDKLHYLVLFGDGSFDYKNINKARNKNTNFIPVYETSQSLDPLLTFSSDDYFALLDPTEGNINADQDLDLGVGRLPVVTADEAFQVVQKIIDYDTKADMMADWRNRLLFICDDQDNNLHINDAEGIANEVAVSDSVYNQEKIYIDAFLQQSTSAGSRYPDANEAILNALFKGSLTVNYLGHGGESGWAQERIFTLSEISKLENHDALPLFITATCSFAPYDDPNIVSAGELLLLKPQGGAIALMTTARVVYADANEQLTSNTFTSLFDEIDANGTPPTTGDVLRNAKNLSGILSKSNSRKFALLGDPSMSLAYPRHQVFTTSINGETIDNVADTLRALQHVTVTGEIRDRNNVLLSGFNGTVYPTVFDKIDTIVTRANDSNSQPRPFSLQKKVIFKGRASVVNGKFTFSFVVPKDISYKFDYGRISYYAEDGNTDAHGMSRNVIIGGTYLGAAADNQGPRVQVYMNDDKFVSGGITSSSPLLYAKLYDENGINTVGNSIGHDLSGRIILTDANETEYILNDFYEAEKDDFTKGVIRYPLKDLPNGNYTAKVKAWDTYNNVGEGETDFVVTSDASLALQHVLNYPNPFTTHTSFQFEHNFPNQTLAVRVQVFTVSGHLLKTIHQTIQTEGYRVDDIEWDGLDDYGDRIGRGVYVYKISVQAENQAGEEQQESEYQKLVILR